ncbi:CARDB domain-containing protein [Natronobacterium texcoconense]|nr:CARDB domain-containing protein [Natronobacterium texcoconense]
MVFLLVASLPAGVAGAAGSGSTAGAAGDRIGPAGAVATVDDEIVVDRSEQFATSVASSSDTLHRATTLRQLPDEPGEFEAEMTFELPDPVTGLEVDIVSPGTVESTDGFEETADGTYEWTETTDTPSIRMTVPADRTGYEGHHRVGSTNDSTGTLSAGSGGGYSFVDTGEWGIVQVPQVGLSWRETESVGFESTATVDGPGATGGDIAVFGEVTEHERTVDGERHRLVVPEAADLKESPEDVLETLAAGSDALEVGERPDELFVVAAPTDVEWGPRGLQYGEGDAWVRADAPIDEPDNVWLHEYVHVRQAFAGPQDGVATETEWLIEAQAEYYAALISLEKGLIGFDEFQRFLERGEQSPYANDVLVEPNSWEDETDYVKGPLVYGELDRQLRLETDGDRTLEDVFRELNARADKGTVTESDFLGALENAGGTEVRESAERYTRTKAVPSTWDRSEHEAAFDQPISTMEYRFATESISVGDESWKQWDRDGETTTAVPVGEPVTVPVAVENVGDRDGTYDATLQVDGSVVDHAQGSLTAGDRTTERLEWTPPQQGVYDLRVGSETMTVFVRGPSSVTVSDLAVEPDDVDPGESVTATATVEAADDRPGAAVLPVRTPEGVAAEESVVVRPGETATLESDLAFDEDGYYEVAVGNQKTTVSVGGLPAAQLEEVPGFGAVTAVVAVFVMLVVSLWRRRL